MAEELMVVVDGIRYRAEDAKRLGLVADKSADTETKEAAKPANKQRTPANKAASKPEEK